ncbi:MAG: hypothetical protein ABI361_07895 [Nitrososphaera sp.]
MPAMHQSVISETTVRKKKAGRHIPSRRIGLALAALIIAALFCFSPKPAYGHFEHFSHYNALSQGVGQYYVYEALDPEYTPPNQPVAMQFSVQDTQGQDTHNIYTMVEVYSALSGERVAAFPWTKQDVGDFQVYYNFPSVGSYQIVLSVAGSQPANPNSIDPPRSILSSSLGCSCDRFVFNVNINRDFGTIFNSTVLVGISLPLLFMGIAMGMAYRRRRKAGQFKLQPGDLVRYVVTFTAIAGGMVHFAVYSEHATLRIEYSIFLITAGGMQVTYGVIYTMLMLVGATYGRGSYPYKHYRKTVAVNLFGLVGSLVLVGLYTYAVIFPPPLSPSNQPEHIDFEGLLAKSLEVFVIAGIVYLMRLEKKKYEQLVRQNV